MSKSKNAALATVSGTIASINELTDSLNAADSLEAAAHIEQEREELRRSLAASSSSDSTVQAGQRVMAAYRPRASILVNDIARAKAVAVGPMVFAALVRDWEASAYNRSGKPNDGTLASALGGYAYDEQGRSHAETPYAFINGLAKRIAQGTMFYEDISFTQTVQKGGTLAEWAFNAARFAMRLCEEGKLERSALDSDVRALLTA